jgi:hypothetical protein
MKRNANCRTNPRICGSDRDDRLFQTDRRTCGQPRGGSRRVKICAGHCQQTKRENEPNCPFGSTPRRVPTNESAKTNPFSVCAKAPRCAMTPKSRKRTQFGHGSIGREVTGCTLILKMRTTRIASNGAEITIMPPATVEPYAPLRCEWLCHQSMHRSPAKLARV